MAKLTSKSRNALASGDFAIPGKRAYPIADKAHARNALSRVAQNGSSSQKAEVRAAVHRKFPGVGERGAPKRNHFAGGLASVPYGPASQMGAGARGPLGKPIARYAGGAADVPGPGQTVTGGTWTPPNSSGNGGQNQDLRAKMKAMGYAGGSSRVVPDSGGMNARHGRDRVPGQVTERPRDTVRAMLSPGEAVVNRAAVKHIPGGRAKIAEANAKGREEMGMRKGLSVMQRDTAGERGGVKGSSGPLTKDMDLPLGPSSRKSAFGGASDTNGMSGMERAMHAHADKMHPVRRR